ncbi:nucleoside 2-deoxyribosyltransferase [Bacillus sp. AK128]
MKFYVASGFTNKENVKRVSNRLKEKGYTHTYDWTINGRAETLEQLKEIGQQEKEAVKASDFLVVILPGGKGTHIELGIALGLSKRIYLYSATEEVFNPSVTSTFYHVPEVKIFIGELDSFISFIISQEENL